VSVGRLERAGAIVIGKTNMHTLGMGTTGLDSHFGPVRNPWRADYIPGGSSSGSAVAVASGLCYATLDTDAIGSCRLPAACCGVVGYKASYGAIDISGILDGEQPPDEAIRWLLHAGVTTRSILDTAFVLDVLAERKGRAPWSAMAAERALRVGVANNLKVEKEVSSVFDSAVETLRSLGCAVSYTPAPLTDFSKGITHIDVDRKEIAGLSFEDIDVLVLPTTTRTTPTVKEASNDPLALSAELTMFANYFGLPAVSVPCGFDGHGLPVGLQMVARAGDDDAVLQLAGAYEQAIQFRMRRPPV
jgi:aspartyl-tRNA(Asn)/glutamyl-tRNA(Gln) amidotransferase subunit A